MTAEGEFRRIDAHQHFWRTSRSDYPWMPADGPLRRNYLPQDLEPLAAQAGIDGSVLVQAAPTVNETEYLLGIAEASSSVLAVVGWVDLEDRSLDDLVRLAGDPKFVGIRPMLQDLEDDAWIARDAVVSALKSVAVLNLTFDLLCYPRHLRTAFEVLREIPELSVVVDHLGKPNYSQLDAEWLSDMNDLAQLPNTRCKIAGFVGEAGANWRNANFTHHFDVVYDLFGPSRLMIGTDWPVLNSVATYPEVVDLYDSLMDGFSVEEQAEMWGGTARRFYGLDRANPQMSES